MSGSVRHVRALLSHLRRKRSPLWCAVQDDLADSLKFTKGDSVFNVCASREMLGAVPQHPQAGEEGALLNSELNGRIFDAIKANVAFEREIPFRPISWRRSRRIDVFDEILLDYFGIPSPGLQGHRHEHHPGHRHGEPSEGPP